MKMWKDDRSEDQMATHTVLVAARDTSSFAIDATSRYGGSTAVWACIPEDADLLFDYVHSRSEMKRVRFTSVENLEKIKGMVHIYVGRPGHIPGW